MTFAKAGIMIPGLHISKIPCYLIDAFKLKLYVITNENKRRPVLHSAKAVRFSHGFHGLTGTLSMN